MEKESKLNEKEMLRLNKAEIKILREKNVIDDFYKWN